MNIGNAAIIFRGLFFSYGKAYVDGKAEAERWKEKGERKNNLGIKFSSNIWYYSRGNEVLLTHVK